MGKSGACTAAKTASRGVAATGAGTADDRLRLVSATSRALAAGALGGLLLSAVLALSEAWSAWSIAPWIVACASVPLYVAVGFIAGDAPRAAYRGLLHAPLYVLTKPLNLRRTLGVPWRHLGAHRASERRSALSRAPFDGLQAQHRSLGQGRNVQADLLNQRCAKARRDRSRYSDERLTRDVVVRGLD